MSKSVKNSGYIWEWERQAWPYYLYLFANQWRHNKFAPPVFAHLTFDKGTANAYLEAVSLKKVGQTIVQNVKKSSFYLRAWKKYIYQSAKELNQFCNKLEKIDFRKIDNKALLGIYNESGLRYDTLTSGVGVIRNANRQVQDELLKVFQNLNTVAVLLSTDEKSFFIQEHESLLRIKELIKKRASKFGINKALKRHISRFYYLPCGYCGEKPLTQNDFKRRLRKAVNGAETIDIFRRQFRYQTNFRNRLVRKLKLSKNLRKLIDFGSTCTFFKDYIRGNLNRLQFFNTLLFKEIASRTKSSLCNVACLMPPEMEGVLLHNKKAGKRAKVVIISNKNGIHLTRGAEASRLINSLKSIRQQKESVIKGIGASPGRARGRVAIVKKLSDIKKVRQKKFVLVTPMTTPDLMPIVKNAAAVVTDEGGLTCHAAIISRELNIPCVIGTKIATKVLKDGDQVEVDANKGIVKKIK